MYKCAYCEDLASSYAGFNTKFNHLPEQIEMIKDGRKYYAIPLCKKHTAENTKWGLTELDNQFELAVYEAIKHEMSI